MRARPQWCVPDMLGSRNVSKSLQPMLLGESRSPCPQTCLCLRAWMLNHMQSTGFMLTKPARRKTWELEAASLRRDVADVDILPRVRALLQQWFPDALR